MTGGVAAWRIWFPALMTILVMMFAITYRTGNVWVPPTGAQTIVILHGGVALLFRLRLPVAVAVLTVGVASVLPLLAGHIVLIDMASIIALYTVASLRPRRTAAIVGLGAAIALTVSSSPWRSAGWSDVRNLLPVNYVSAAVAVGDAARNRRALLAEIHERALLAEQTREEEAHRRVREERIRIARDLHDVVAHHITLVNAQAGVAHHLMDTHPGRARQALAGIRETSRAALDELRATVGLLRDDDEPAQPLIPAPSFDDLDALLGTFRDSGFQITVTRSGEPRPLPPATGVAAFRIVQEALTNAGKHATGRRAALHLAYERGALHLTVTNPARPGHRGPGTGHGLIGMRERAEAAGGELNAAMGVDGVHTVRAVLPLPEPAPPLDIAP